MKGLRNGVVAREFLSFFPFLDSSLPALILRLPGPRSPLWVVVVDRVVFPFLVVAAVIVGSY